MRTLDLNSSKTLGFKYQLLPWTDGFLDSFAKLRSFVFFARLSVHRPAWNKSAPAERILMKSDI
jgi:hypothetical protein